MPQRPATSGACCDPGLGIPVQEQHRVAQDPKGWRFGRTWRGFYFRNVSELLLFGTRGKHARTLAPGRSQVNYMCSRKPEHSRKPDEQYPIIEACSMGPYIELFARGEREGWESWGNEADENYRPTWKTYSNHSRSQLVFPPAMAFASTRRLRRHSE